MGKVRISKGLEVFYNSLNYEMFPIKKKINKYNNICVLLQIIENKTTLGHDKGLLSVFSVYTVTRNSCGWAGHTAQWQRDHLHA